MRKLVYILCVGMLMGCSVGDETHNFSDNENSTIIVNEDGGCFTCFDTIEYRDAWVPDELMCEGSAEIRQALQTCASPMNACQTNFVDDKPMINNCLETLMHTGLCHEKFFDCVLDEGNK